MGWTTSTAWDTRAKLVSDLMKPYGHETKSSKPLTYCLRGNILWSVWEIADSCREPVKTERFIRCDLLCNYGKGEGWGYKGMTESMHPYYYTCPLKYLDMAPVARPEWRDKVKAYHDKQSLVLRPGLIVELSECVIPCVQIASERSKAGWWNAKDRDGSLYRVKREHLTGQVFETWPSDE